MFDDSCRSWVQIPSGPLYFMIKAIIFDIDGTLVDSHEANISFYQSIFKVAGFKIPDKSLFDNFLHLSMIDTIKTLAPSSEDVEKLWNIGNQIKYPSQLQKLFPFSQKVISILSHNYKLAIVTNRRKEGVNNYFSLSRLENYFSVIVAVEDVVNKKPHPEPLLLASERLAIKASECVYVGDACVDVLSAKAAGMKVITTNPLEGADEYFDSFEQLLLKIEKIQ